MKTRNQIIAALTITCSLAFAPVIHAAERSQPLKGSRPDAAAEATPPFALRHTHAVGCAWQAGDGLVAYETHLVVGG